MLLVVARLCRVVSMPHLAVLLSPVAAIQSFLCRHLRCGIWSAFSGARTRVFVTPSLTAVHSLFLRQSEKAARHVYNL